MAADMHDLKYSELFKEGAADWEAPVIKSQSVQLCADAFAENIVRIAVFSFMPAKIAFSVRRDQLWTDCAELELLGKLNPDFFKFSQFSSPLGLTEKLSQIKKDFDLIHCDQDEVKKISIQLALNISKNFSA